MENKARQSYRVAVMLIAAIILLPWGSRTHYNTKGEPREAIVAVSMLESGNWILPESHGHDIPYKPPMLAWCIASISKITGGEVTEYTSRLPSALAALALVAMTFNWVARRRDSLTAALTALVTLTTFELFRNAVICRVDMLLTFFTAGSIYLLDNEGFSRKRQALRVAAAILLMTCAVLTKGPVGSLLPCLVVGVYRLFRRHNFFATLLKMTGIAIASMAIPALWYYAAYQQGGSSFLELAWEENIGRMTGTMSYDSHVNPWWYPIVSVIWGIAPYTILAIFAAFAAAAIRRRNRTEGWLMPSQLRPDALLALLSAVIIIGFYCLPSSKRSVYVLPAYPFVAFGLVMMSQWLIQRRSKAVNAYAATISVLAITATTAIIALRCGAGDFIHGKSAVMVGYLANGNISWWEWAFMLLPGITGIATLTILRPMQPLLRSAVTLISMYLLFMSTVQPLMLNPRSNIHAAKEIKDMSPEGTIYSFIDDRLMRYYTVNFYLGDRMRNLEKTDATPEDGSLVLMNSRLLEDAEKLRPEIGFRPTGRSFVSCDRRRDTVQVYMVYLKPTCSNPCAPKPSSPYSENPLPMPTSAPSGATCTPK